MRIISGSLKNKTLIVPKGPFVRPTSSMVRESVFNICQNYIADSVFLDLFAGSGAMGIEALSRGAAHATFVDREKEAIKCVDKNLEQLNLTKQGNAICGDVLSVLSKLKKLGKKFDIIYADPPYGKELKAQDQIVTYSLQILKMIDQYQLLNEEGHLFIEDIKNALSQTYHPAHLELIDQRRMGRTNLFHYKQMRIKSLKSTFEELA